MTNEIELVLGYPVPKDKQGTISDLRHIGPIILEELKKVGAVFNRELLLFYTTPDNWQYINTFLANVVYENRIPNEWSNFSYIVPDVSLKDQLTKEIHEILYFTKGKFSHLIKSNYNLWKSNILKSGSPAIFIENGYYKTDIPKNFQSFSKFEVLKIEKEDSSHILFRRWIASRIAKCMDEKLFVFNDIEEFNYFSPIEKWTDDAKFAFYGLLRERNEMGWKDDEIPGYVGPDDFYE